MRWTWGQELRQQGNHRELWNREREDARAESCYGVLDHVLLLFESQSVHVSPTACLCRCAGDAQIEYAANLVRCQQAETPQANCL